MQTSLVLIDLNQTTLTLDDDIFQDGGGDAADGIFFVRANRSADRDESDSYFYAGIIPETDLGAPLSETSGTGNVERSIQRP